MSREPIPPSLSCPEQAFQTSRPKPAKPGLRLRTWSWHGAGEGLRWSPGRFEFPGAIHPTAIMLSVKPDDLFYSPGPLYHDARFFFSVAALISGGRVPAADGYGRLHQGRRP